MNMQPFSMPDPNTVQAISAVSGSATLGDLLGTGNQIMFINTTSQACYVAVGDGAVAAAVGFDIVIHGNSTIVFTISPDTTNVSARTPSGTTTLLFARGEGF